MPKKLVPTLIIIAGLAVTLYGIFTAPVKNEFEIFDKYNCYRHTKVWTPTDTYCSYPEDAPDARVQYANSYLFTGIAIFALGLLYDLKQRGSQKREQ